MDPLKLKANMGNLPPTIEELVQKHRRSLVRYSAEPLPVIRGAHHCANTPSLQCAPVGSSSGLIIRRPPHSPPRSMRQMEWDGRPPRPSHAFEAALPWVMRCSGFRRHDDAAVAVCHVDSQGFGMMLSPSWGVVMLRWW